MDVRRLTWAVVGPFTQLGTWASITYVVLGALPALVFLLLVLTGLAVGAATAVVGVGVPVLIATMALAVELADLDRRLINTMLGARIGALPVPAGVRALLTGGRTWRAFAWLLLRGVGGAVTVVAGSVVVVVLVALVALPFVDGYLAWGTDWRSPAGLASAWALPAAGVLLMAALHLTRAAAGAHRRAARTLLGADEAEQVASLQAEAGTLQERALLARELHDGIGHALSVIVLQAEAARASGSPAARPPDDAFAVIADTGRRALDDLDVVLAALQADDAPLPRPAPSLAALPALVARARAAGLPVEASTDAAAEVHLAGPVAYRIVQEACTNAIRHAGAGPTRVRITAVAGWLEVEVRSTPTDPPTDPPTDRGGRGLAGLAERVRLAGGQWSAGLTPGGDWLVAARLPGGR